jgi:hypothetical protein
MIMNRLFRSRGLAVGVAAALVLLTLPVAEFAQTKAPAAAASDGSLVGFVYARDMKTPVANAVVKIRNIEEPKAYDSEPSDANGMYRITGIKEGRYILGVTATEGDYNFDYVMSLKGNDMAKLSLALSTGGQTTGTDAPKKSFFASAGGIALIVVAAGAILYAIFSSKEEESPDRR